MDKPNIYGDRGHHGVISQLINSASGIEPALPPPTHAPSYIRPSREVAERRDRKIRRKADRRAALDSLATVVGVNFTGTRFRHFTG